MSDSDSDEAFESADEGDEIISTHASSTNVELPCDDEVKEKNSEVDKEKEETLLSLKIAKEDIKECIEVEKKINEEVNIKTKSETKLAIIQDNVTDKHVLKLSGDKAHNKSQAILCADELANESDKREDALLLGEVKQLSSKVDNDKEDALLSMKISKEDIKDDINTEKKGENEVNINTKPETKLPIIQNNETGDGVLKGNEKKDHDKNQDILCAKEHENKNDKSEDVTRDISSIGFVENDVPEDAESKHSLFSNCQNSKDEKINTKTSESASINQQQIEDVKDDDDNWDVGWEIDDLDLDIDVNSTVSSDPAQVTKTVDCDEKKSATSALNKLAAASEKTSDWGWGGWGSSLLSTATASVSTFTDHVGQGLGSVLESMESTLGAPSPEEMAAISDNNKSSKTKEEIEKTTKSSENEPAFKFGNLLSGVSNILESTSSKVIEGSVGALETIGKKTIDILTDGDPQLRKKRSMLSGNRPVLSQVLRQAKQQNEAQEVCNDENVQSPIINFPLVFDKYNGLVHLEALEMLSGQSKIKVESRRTQANRSAALNDILDKIEDICSDLPDTDEDEEQENFTDVMTEFFSSLNVDLSPSKLIQVVKEQDEKFASMESPSATDCYEAAIVAQAMLTARTVEQLHKIAEILLLGSSTEALSQAESIAGIAVRVCSEIEILSTKYAEKLLNLKDDTENINHFTTNIYFEMSNSTTYIHDAMKLMVSVLQLIATMN